MPDIERLRKNLEANGFRTVCFDTGEEVRAYLDRELDGVTIGFGGSETSWKLGLYQLLSRHNQCRWVRMGDAAAEAVNAPCYICSLNGVAETGELVNIDGNGNRVAATLYGKEKLSNRHNWEKLPTSSCWNTFQKSLIVLLPPIWRRSWTQSPQASAR